MSPSSGKQIFPVVNSKEQFHILSFLSRQHRQASRSGTTLCNLASLMYLSYKHRKADTLQFGSPLVDRLVSLFHTDSGINLAEILGKAGWI